MNFYEFIRSLGKKPDDLTDKEKRDLWKRYKKLPASKRSSRPGEGAPPDGDDDDGDDDDDDDAGDSNGGAVITPPAGEGGSAREGLTPLQGPGSQTPEAIEATRQTAIRELAALAGLQDNDESITSAIRSGVPADIFRQRLAGTVQGQRSAPVPPAEGPAVIVPDTQATRGALAMAVAAMCGNMRGHNADTSAMSAQQREAHNRTVELSQRFSTMAALEICRECVQLDGNDVPHGRDQVIQRAFSGGTFGTILTSTAEGMLHAAYQESPDTASPWTTASDVNDFKPNNRVRTAGAGNLKKHARGGAADHDDGSDQNVPVQVQRYSEQFKVDEMDIIDDSFGALMNKPQEFGVAARRTELDLVYAHLLANGDYIDSVALFHATHANLETGAGSAFDSEALQLLLNKLAVQTGLRGQVLNLMGRYILVPPVLQFEAGQAVNSAEVRGASVEKGTSNPLAALNLTPISEPRLQLGVTDPDSGTAYSGSTTAWYVVGDPSAAPTLERQYLRGTNRSPTIRSWVLNSDGEFGIGFDVKHDTGVKALDFRNMQKSNGA